MSDKGQSMLTKQELMDKLKGEQARATGYVSFKDNKGWSIPNGGWPVVDYQAEFEQFLRQRQAPPDEAQ